MVIRNRRFGGQRNFLLCRDQPEKRQEGDFTGICRRVPDSLDVVRKGNGSGTVIALHWRIACRWFAGEWLKEEKRRFEFLEPKGGERVVLWMDADGSRGIKYEKICMDKLGVRLSC